MTLVLLAEKAPGLTIEREPEGIARREDALRDLLFANPAMLPLRELEPGIGRVIAVARELNVPDVGRIDALLIDEHGRLIIVECKLWRNPQARREVIGQILDYARALAKFSYDDLQREVSSATKRPGNVLFELARGAGSEMDEARFVDRVSRDLAAGRFILLIVGDGITEGTQRIGEYLQAQPGLAFTFGMVEMAQYRFNDPLVGQERVIVQPRLLARTVSIDRLVIRSEVPGVILDEQRPERANPIVSTSPVNLELAEQWRQFSGRLIEQVRFDDPGQPSLRRGGLGWLRVPLPGPAHLTLWRSYPQQAIGAFIRYAGAEGLETYELLASERISIDAEFEEAGMSVPVWSGKSDEGMIALEAAASLPWVDSAQASQIDWFTKAANRFVNSMRPRLLALGHSGS